jgi:CubicO group peptidase (beta-lactamase class C family)
MNASRRATHRFRAGLPLLLALSLAACTRQSAAQGASAPPRLEAAFAQAKGFEGLTSLVACKDGKVVAELYQGGDGSSLHDLRSVTKTVTGLLVGIAVDKGIIRSIDQPISDYLGPAPKGAAPGIAGITIRHLLTMSSGFAWNELGSAGAYNSWAGAPDQTAFALARPMASAPGASFAYDSPSLHLLSVILSRASGMNTEDFAELYLFPAIGIERFSWERDEQGISNGAAGLELSPRDMVALGRLILGEGEYEGRRIVSAGWVSQARSQRISSRGAQPYGPGYGLGMWTGRIRGRDYAFANGYGGQFIVVVPSLSLVVCATNEWKGVPGPKADRRWFESIRLIMEGILPAFE